jgi:hypothetical protein
VAESSETQRSPSMDRSAGSGGQQRCLTIVS